MCLILMSILNHNINLQKIALIQSNILIFESPIKRNLFHDKSNQPVFEHDIESLSTLRKFCSQPHQNMNGKKYILNTAMIPMVRTILMLGINIQEKRIMCDGKKHQNEEGFSSSGRKKSLTMLEKERNKERVQENIQVLGEIV